jgi:S1-C subfamily serine protease
MIFRSTLPAFLLGSISFATPAQAYELTGLRFVMDNNPVPTGDLVNYSLDGRLIPGRSRFVHVALAFENGDPDGEPVVCTMFNGGGWPGEPVHAEISSMGDSGVTPLLATFGPFETGVPLGQRDIECATEDGRARGRIHIDAFTTTELVEAVRPSIVLIRELGTGTKDENDATDPDCRNEPFGSGTGFVIDATGLILTNNHVVDPCPADWPDPPLEVQFSDGTRVKPSLVLKDPLTDLAVVKVEGLELQALPFHPLLVEVGEDVVAIGFALTGVIPGEPSVTRGVVSAIARSIFPNADPESGVPMADLIQTDAAINRGNSGGPLVDLYGQVVGINALGYSGGQALNFALSPRVATAVVAELLANGTVRRGDMGIVGNPVTETGVAALGTQGISLAVGLVVTAVAPGSAADRAVAQSGSAAAQLVGGPPVEGGLRPCDLIERINYLPITSFGDFLNAMLWNRPGETVEVAVRRYPPEKCGARSEGDALDQAERLVEAERSAGEQLVFTVTLD